MGIMYSGVSNDSLNSSEGSGLPPALPENTLIEMLIVECEQHTSKSGNEMFKAVLQAVDPIYNDRRVYEYIVNSEYFDMKMARILASAGRNTENSGLVEADHLVGLKVTVKLRHEKYDGKTREKVAFYCPQSEAVEQKQQAPSADSVPF